MKYFSGLNFINIGTTAECRIVFQRNNFTYWGIQYNHYGKFRVMVDDLPEQVIDGPSVLLTRPGRSYIYGAVKGETRHHNFVCFDGPRIQSYLDGDLLPNENSQQIFKILHPEIFMQRFLELKNLLTENITPTNDRAVNILEGMFLMMHQIEEPDKGSPHLSDPLKQLAEEIRRQPELDWNFQTEAESINISYMHFRRAFKQHLGIPPGRFLQRCRLDKAAEELLSGDKQIGRIAEENGFDDQQYFSRVFKQYFLLSPRQYRREFGVF